MTWLTHRLVQQAGGRGEKEKFLIIVIYLQIGLLDIQQILFEGFNFLL
jgi:hypothetical protein